MLFVLRVDRVVSPSESGDMVEKLAVSVLRRHEAEMIVTGIEFTASAPSIATLLGLPLAAKFQAGEQYGFQITLDP